MLAPLCPGVATAVSEQTILHGMWARQIEEWAQHLRAVYVYFDNDQAGYAAKNALRLKTILGMRSERSAA